MVTPNAPSITNVASTNPTECGVADGTITITATGGTAPLEYSINGGTNWVANGGTFTGLAGGTYQIRVRNNGGTCVITYPDVTLINKALPTIANVASTNATNCNVNDGTITITASSTQGAVEYSIDGGSFWSQSGTFTGLTAGTYQIRVRNIDGTCTVSNADITITTPTAPAITNVTPTDPSNCGVNDGTIVITATAGSAATQYSIDGGVNWQSSNTFNNLSAGTYNVFVRNTGNTCTVAYASNPVVLGAPNAPQITNVSSTNPTNCGVTDGTITITATGGSGSYQYSIDGGTTFTNTTGIFTGLTGGTYQIRVRNDNATCVVSYQNITLIDKISPIIANVASTNVTNCGVIDGTITITASSAQGAVEYSINGGTSWSQSGTFTGLTAGTYQIRVRNIDGTCTVSNTDVIITAPVQPAITNVVPVNPSNCGVSDGTITITATGSNLRYSIDGGTNWQAGNIFSSLGAGTYNVAVRYANGTCVTLNPTNPVILTAPNAPSITNVFSTNPTDCGVTDGTITIQATGGTAPLQYSINGGANWQASNNFTGLAGGSYQIRVRNANGSCEVSSTDVTLINKISPVIASVASTNVTNCNVTDGSITITASSAQGSIEYSINGGTTWQPSNVFTNLTAGTYQIRVRNIDGSCLTSNPNVVITAPVAPAITNVAPANPSNCGVNDGTITVTATAGTGATSYSIDGGQNWQASNTFNGLAAGTYNVQVRNSNGSCVVVNASNPIVLTAPNAPSITNVSSTNPTDCGTANGTVTITATGGSGSLEYSIDSGATWQSSNTFTGLSAAANNPIEVLVRNDNGTCTVSYPTITLTDKALPV
ncbi:MAG: hypothetical protein HC803_03950, partial [Saprospiraceae bacterium]|nr:hypothetical protein [Saprospiraceae bacterium]